ncbi:MAG: hypothetical protein U1E08_00330 [Coriobacteriia bacterium]|nr:hypothetical protein [Actinomycetota bacterium]MDZ4166134.1 hypothetical protein [Coriobacteriia bacterium]
MGVRRVLLPLVLLLVATTLLSCGPTDIVTYVPEGGIYRSDDLATLIASADLGKTAAVTTGEAPEVRQDALTQLRGYGDDAVALADTLTSDFPLDMAAVPVYVERGSYEGEPAWIVIEATADDAGTLTYRRLWVLSYTERAVIAAQSAR